MDGQVQLLYKNIIILILNINRWQKDSRRCFRKNTSFAQNMNYYYYYFLLLGKCCHYRGITLLPGQSFENTTGPYCFQCICSEDGDNLKCCG